MTALIFAALGSSIATIAIAQDNFCSAAPVVSGQGIVGHQLAIYHYDPTKFVYGTGYIAWALKVRPRNGYCIRNNDNPGAHWTKMPYRMTDLGFADGVEFYQQVSPNDARNCNDAFKSVKWVGIPSAQSVYNVYTQYGGRMTTVEAAIKYAYGSPISPSFNGDIKTMIYVRPQLSNGVAVPNTLEVAGICRLQD